MTSTPMLPGKTKKLQSSVETPEFSNSCRKEVMKDGMSSLIESKSPAKKKMVLEKFPKETVELIGLKVVVFAVVLAVEVKIVVCTDLVLKILFVDVDVDVGWLVDELDSVVGLAVVLVVAAVVNVDAGLLLDELGDDELDNDGGDDAGLVVDVDVDAGLLVDKLDSVVGLAVVLVVAAVVNVDAGLLLDELDDDELNDNDNNEGLVVDVDVDAGLLVDKLDSVVGLAVVLVVAAVVNGDVGLLLDELDDDELNDDGGDDAGPRAIRDRVGWRASGRQKGVRATPVPMRPASPVWAV